MYIYYINNQIILMNIHKHIYCFFMASIDVRSSVKILRPPSKIVEHVSFNRTHPNSMTEIIFANQLKF